MAMACLGCRRGCASELLEGPKKATEAPLELSGTDCPAGLVRCREGRVERSLGGHVPVRCERGESCTCPFVTELECPGGCLLEGEEVFLGDAGGALCRTSGARSVPVVSPAPEGVCDSDDARCVGGALVVCAPSPRTVARCLRGCAGPGVVGPDVPVAELEALCAP